MEQEKKQMTVAEGLRITMNLLNSIEVPVSIMEKVGIPVARAVSNINECIAALEEAERRAKEQPNIDDMDISIEPVTEEEVRNGNADAE